MITKKKKEKKKNACKKLSHHVRVVTLRQVQKSERIHSGTASPGRIKSDH